MQGGWLHSPSCANRPLRFWSSKHTGPGFWRKPLLGPHCAKSPHGKAEAWEPDFSHSHSRSNSIGLFRLLFGLLRGEALLWGRRERTNKERGARDSVLVKHAHSPDLKAPHFSPAAPIPNTCVPQHFYKLSPLLQASGWMKA